jgi:acyl-CoA thioesterase-2
MTLLDTTVLPHGLSWEGGTLMMASLDHAMWFHRSFRADDWLLYDLDTPSGSHARGLARDRSSPPTGSWRSRSCRRASSG